MSSVGTIGALGGVGGLNGGLSKLDIGKHDVQQQRSGRGTQQQNASSSTSSTKKKEKEKKKSRNQKLYELLVPKSSEGAYGRFGECRWGTMPYLKTLIRMEEYDRTLTRAQQLHRDTKLAEPKTRKDVVGASTRKVNSWQSRCPQWGNNRVDTRTYKTLPPVDKKAAVDALHFKLQSRKNEDKYDHIDNTRYSETPFHKKKQASKVFDVSDYVSRERAIITSGRTFTWGGRMKYVKPPFNPDRSRQISQTQLR